MAVAVLPASGAVAQDTTQPAYGSRDTSLEFSYDNLMTATGLWSDGSTMWITDTNSRELKAFTITEGSSDFGQPNSAKDIDTNAEEDDNTSLQGAWSDGTTIWTIRQYPSGASVALAYILSDGSSSSSSNIALSGGGNSSWAPRGLWTDETTMYVVDATNRRVRAYTLDTGDRDSSKDLNLHSSHTRAQGAYSDGTTVWIADRGQRRMFAYTLETGARDTSKEFTLTSANGEPFGIWSDGTTMWVNDFTDRKVYAYSVAAGSQVGGL